MQAFWNASAVHGLPGDTLADRRASLCITCAAARLPAPAILAHSMCSQTFDVFVTNTNVLSPHHACRHGPGHSALLLGDRHRVIADSVSCGCASRAAHLSYRHIIDPVRHCACDSTPSITPAQPHCKPHNSAAANQSHWSCQSHNNLAQELAALPAVPTSHAASLQSSIPSFSEVPVELPGPSARHPAIGAHSACRPAEQLRPPRNHGPAWTPAGARPLRQRAFAAARAVPLRPGTAAHMLHRDAQQARVRRRQHDMPAASASNLLLDDLRPKLEHMCAQLHGVVQRGKAPQFDTPQARSKLDGASNIPVRYQGYPPPSPGTVGWHQHDSQVANEPMRSTDPAGARQAPTLAHLQDQVHLLFAAGQHILQQVCLVPQSGAVTMRMGLSLAARQTFSHAGSP